MKTSTILFAAAQALLATANPVPEVEERQSCPSVHVFGARETTASAGYGSSSTVVNLVLGAYSGSTAEAIVYPACGGQSSCGSVSYDSSQKTGTQAVVTAVNAYVAKCPSTKIVLVGYSQGGQIMDQALCGGGSATLSAASIAAVKASIWMGTPTYVAGLSYDVGTCTAGGFAARPSGFSCSSAANIKSYCDAADPYCCNGSNTATHQGYGSEYGQQALTFVKSKLA